MKYKVGDRVRIVEKAVDFMPLSMNRYLGKTMTIEVLGLDFRGFSFLGYVMEGAPTLLWQESMIAGLARDCFELKISCPDGEHISTVYRVNDKTVETGELSLPSSEIDGEYLAIFAAVAGLSAQMPDALKSFVIDEESGVGILMVELGEKKGAEKTDALEDREK
ncbi:MAG: hypothetical protein RR394_08625 [Oscillospiraceae bacterium]